MAQLNVTGLPAASDSMAAGAATDRWSRREVVALAGVVLVGIAIRVLLLPTPGLRGDLDQFVGWVHHIATNGLGTIYGQTAAGPVTFGPVMAYVWGLLAAIEPAFRTVTDASDPAIRALMKLPASAADVGLALLVAYALRDRPRWAVVGAAAILLHPAVIDVSAWWGQYESIYLLSALAAAILAINGRNGWAAAAIAVSLMTKPQALPLARAVRGLVLGDRGMAGFVRAAAIGAIAIAGLWLPFVADGGPVSYLRNLGAVPGRHLRDRLAPSLEPLVARQEPQRRRIRRRQRADRGPADASESSASHWPGSWRSPSCLACSGTQRPRTLLLGLATSVLVAFRS